MGNGALAPLPDFTCLICGGHEFAADFEHQYATVLRGGMERIVFTGTTHVTLRCCGCRSWIKYVHYQTEGIWREAEAEIVLRTA